MYPFHDMFNIIFFGLLCLLQMISLFKMSPKYSAKFLFRVPKHKVVVCQKKKIQVLDKLYSGMSCTAIG